MMNYTGTAGTFRNKVVYKYNNMDEYIQDVLAYFRDDFYALVDNRRLCYGLEEIGEVKWGRDGDNDVIVWNRPRKLRQPLKPKEDEVRVEEVINMKDLSHGDIELMSIEDIIKDIQKLHISFE